LPLSGGGKGRIWVTQIDPWAAFYLGLQ